MRILLAVLLLLLLLPDYASEPRRQTLGSRARIEAQRVPLFPDDPGRTRLGALTYLGGVRLTSPDRAFGGFSAMAVSGDRFTLLGDGGTIVEFSMGADWRVRAPRFANLPAGPGQGWLKEDRDSESLAFDPATGRLWVGFEHWNSIWRYAPGFARAERRSAPPAMAEWAQTRGPEAMARLADGSFLTVAEDFGEFEGLDVRAHPALLFRGDPTLAPRRGFAFALVPPAGFRVTDAAELPGGDIAMLARRATLSEGFTARLVVVKRSAIRRGAVVRGQVVARLEAPAQHDNFEALAITREHGATIVWIASDDNGSIFQQSLLLKFRLGAAEPEKAD